jgi:DNA-binding beta-propeller fold protein YncE
VIASVPVGREPLSLCYNPTNDRVYCPCKGDTICGIDAATNRVASVVSHGHGATLACDPARNVLLVSADYALAVVDCSADTVLAEFESIEGTADLIAYDSMDDKIYMIYGYPGG